MFFTIHPWTIFSGNTHSTSFTRAMNEPRHGYRLQKMSFCVQLCECCHNTYTCTPKMGATELLRS